METQHRPDKRQMRRIKAAISKAERRLNEKIIIRIAELSKDDILKKKILEEMKDLKTREDFNEYIGRAHDIARNETR
jgi:hypothetical protein